MTNSNILRLVDIRARYHSKEILRRISLSIRKGQVVSVVGPNGAGKSTLLRVIAGILAPIGGDVYFNEKKITTSSTKSRIKAGMGYLLQGAEVFSGLTVAENLKVSASVNGNENRKKDGDEILDLFSELRERLHQQAGLLSGGERQMLALALLMQRKPTLLLLDEPTAGLAPGLAKNVLGKIIMNANTRMDTVIIVEQNIKLAVSFSERLVAMQRGDIVYDGSPDGILEQDVINRMFGFISK